MARSMARRTAGPLVGLHYYDDGLDPQPSGFHLVSLDLIGAAARYGTGSMVLASTDFLGSRSKPGPSVRRLVRRHGGKLSVAALGLDRNAWPKAGVWHAVHGGLKELLQWREVGITGAAPLTAMQHGYPEIRGLFELLFYDVRPSDTFICSANAGRSVIADMLDNLSDRLGLDVSKRLPMHFEVVPYGVDVDTFRPRRDRPKLRRQFGLPQNAMIVLVLGRMSPAWKGDVLPLLGAFRRVQRARSRKNLLLVLAGYFRDDENYQRVVTHFIGELGLGESVMVLGNVEPSRRHLLLAAADVSVSVSEFLGENFGLVPLEAMACGVPQIVSSWNGYRDTVVDGKTGFCVRTSWAKWDGDLGGASPFLGHVAGWVAGQTVALDTRELEARLGTLVDDASLRASMAVESRRRAERDYAWPKIIPQFEQIWSEAIAQAQRESRARRRARPKLSLYDMFKRQASHVLEDRAYVELPTNGGAASEGSYPLPIYGELELFFSGNVAADMLALARASGSVRVGELLRNARKRCGIERDLATRHLLFLLKHGLLVLPRRRR